MLLKISHINTNIIGKILINCCTCSENMTLIVHVKCLFGFLVEEIGDFCYVFL